MFETLGEAEVEALGEVEMVDVAGSECVWVVLPSDDRVVSVGDRDSEDDGACDDPKFRVEVAVGVGAGVDVGVLDEPELLVGLEEKLLVGD